MNLDISQWTIDPILSEGYRAECAAAAADPDLFARFRRGKFMGGVVENKPQDWPALMLETVRAAAPEILDHWEDIRRLDAIGDPPRPPLPDGRPGLSGSMAGYLMQAAMLRYWFGLLDGLRIVELGGGYGGLAALVSLLWRPASYTIFDLPEACDLQDRYLHAAGVPGAFLLKSRLQSHPSDLFISSCGLCEMGPGLVEAVGRRLIASSARGMFGGCQLRTEAGRADGHPAVSAQLAQWLPGRRFRLGAVESPFAELFSTGECHWGSSYLFWERVTG